MKELKTLPAKELGHLLYIEFFFVMTETQETRIRVQASNNFPFFRAELSKMKKKRRTVIGRKRGGLTFKTASSLAVYTQWYTHVFE